MLRTTHGDANAYQVEQKMFNFIGRYGHRVDKGIGYWIWLYMSGNADKNYFIMHITPIIRAFWQ